MMDWHFSTDFLIVGSGAGGLTAALAAHQRGLDVLVVEKSVYIGGSSALSGGGLWIPNNPFQKAAGVSDSPEKALTYLQHTIGSRTSLARQQAYLDYAPKMLHFLQTHTHAQFIPTPNYPDYYPELPGGLSGGRSLEPVPLNSRRLGQQALLVRPSNIQPPLGMGVTALEARHLYMLTRSPAGMLAGMGVFISNLPFILSGGSRWTLGRALVGRLLQSILEQGIPVWRNAAASTLIHEKDIVTGIIVNQAGKDIRVRVNRGILLAAGGFEHNQDMRQEYLPQPTQADWSAGNPANTGDAIRMGQAAGAALDLMDDAWWTPVSLPPDSPPMIHVGERSFPCQLIVDASGVRFANEASPYHQFGHNQYARQAASGNAIPCYMIFDQHFRNRYLFGQTLPFLTPAKFLESGYFQRASTLVQLAGRINVDPQALQNTVAQFNAYAQTGQDPDFHRGESAYDRYYGDPSTRPNPCLGPIEKPPFYAVALYPGDLGTKGGLLTDARARVVKPDGKVIQKLYACGNTSASVMGYTYPGAGSTLGPAMTFGFRAALDAASPEENPLIGEAP
jgi:3-oxosteroid 1-dehydrogenase